MIILSVLKKFFFTWRKCSRKMLFYGQLSAEMKIFLLISKRIFYFAFLKKVLKICEGISKRKKVYPCRWWVHLDLLDWDIALIELLIFTFHCIIYTGLLLFIVIKQLKKTRKTRSNSSKFFFLNSQIVFI